MARLPLNIRRHNSVRRTPVIRERQLVTRRDDFLDPSHALRRRLLPVHRS